MQQATDSSQSPQWADRWLQETHGKECWGFTQFTDHGDIEKRLAEEDYLDECEIKEEVPRILDKHDRRVDEIVSSVLQSAGCDESLFERFELQDIAWPQSSIDQGQERWNVEAEEARERDLDELDALEDEDGDEELDLENEDLDQSDESFLAKQKFLDEEEAGEFRGDASLRANFQVLRNQFRALRDSPRRPTQEEGDEGGEDRDGKDDDEDDDEEGDDDDDDNDNVTGLHMGILDNVFIVIDKTCVDSQNTTSGWVFAVDPDYQDPGPREPLSLKMKQKYRGFLRVKTEHLVNEFFELRKYHALDRPFKALCDEAQKTGNGYFVPTATACLDS